MIVYALSGFCRPYKKLLLLSLNLNMMWVIRIFAA